MPGSLDDPLLLLYCPEPSSDFRRSCHEAAHDFGVQQIPVRIGILRDHAMRRTVIDQDVEHSLGPIRHKFVHFVAVRLAEPEILQQQVAAVIRIRCLDQAFMKRESHQHFNGMQNLLGFGST